MFSEYTYMVNYPNPSLWTFLFQLDQLLSLQGKLMNHTRWCIFSPASYFFQCSPASYMWPYLDYWETPAEYLRNINMKLRVRITSFYRNVWMQKVTNYGCVTDSLGFLYICGSCTVSFMLVAWHFQMVLRFSLYFSLYETIYLHFVTDYYYILCLDFLHNQ